MELALIIYWLKIVFMQLLIKMGKKSGLKKVDTHQKSFDLVIELLPTPSA